METKLTLKLESSVIVRAKGYARKRKTSLSKLVESYLDSVSAHTQDETATISPLVKSLSGKINLPADFDYKKEYAHYLKKRHRQVNG